MFKVSLFSVKEVAFRNETSLLFLKIRNGYAMIFASINSLVNVKQTLCQAFICLNSSVFRFEDVRMNV